MFGKKTKTVQGIHVKQRTRAEVDQDYSSNAAYYGHKQRVIAGLKQDIEKLEAECAMHLENLLKINKEGMALPAVPTQAMPAPKAVEEVEEAPPGDCL